MCKIDIDEDEQLSDGVVNTTSIEDSKKKTDDTIIVQQDDNQSEAHTQNAMATNTTFTGYIGMLAVEQTHRRCGIGTALVQRAIHRMRQMGCQSIRLETEVTNKAAMQLYEDRLGFVREELLKKYYLNWGDAYRLRLWLT